MHSQSKLSFPSKGIQIPLLPGDLEEIPGGIA